MPSYQSEGTEPLKQGAAKVLSGSVKAQPKGDGTPCGGTENTGANAQVISGAVKSIPGGGQNATPDGVQSFKDTV